MTEKNNGYLGSFVQVIQNPVYLIFTVIIFIYAFTGSLSETALVSVAFLFSVFLRSWFLYRAGLYFGKKGTAVGKAAGDKRGEIVKGLSRICSLFSGLTLCGSAVLILVGLLTSYEGGIGSVLSRALALLSLSLAIPGGGDGSVLEYAASLILSGKDGEESGTVICSTDAAERIASSDTSLIMNPLVFFDSTPAVRELWYSASVYRGTALEGSGLVSPAALMSVISMQLLALNPEGFHSVNSHEEAVLDLFSIQSEGKNNPFSSCSFGNPLLNFPGTGDVTVITVHKGVAVLKDCLIRSTSSDILSRCSAFRLIDGNISEMTDRYFKDISTAVGHMTDSGLSVYYYVTAPENILTTGQSYDYVLECICAVGGVFPENNQEVLASLEDFGVRPLLVLPSDNNASKNFAAECGLVNGSKTSVSFEEYSGENAGSPIEMSASIFTGFSSDAVTSLSRRLCRNGAGITAVVRRRSDLSVMSSALASACLENPQDSSLALSCDSCIPPASESGNTGGLWSLFSLFTLSVSFCSKLFMIRNTLLSFAAILTAAVLFPVISGADGLSVNASAVLFCGSFFSLASVAVFSGEELFMRSRTCIDECLGKDSLNILKYCGLGLISAAALCVTGVLAFSGNSPYAGLFVISALILSGPSVLLSERISERRRLGIGGINMILIIYILLSLILSLGFCFLGGKATGSLSFDISEALRTFLLALIPGAVPLAYGGADLLIRTASGQKKSAGIVNKL